MAIFEKFLNRYLHKRAFTKSVNIIEVNMSNGERISSSIVTLDRSKSVGEALTGIIDGREDKSMNLIGYRIVC